MPIAQSFCVFIDKLSVQYLGVNNHGHDDGVVLADCPASMRRAVYWFEMTVRTAGLKGLNRVHHMWGGNLGQLTFVGPFCYLVSIAWF